MYGLQRSFRGVFIFTELLLLVCGVYAFPSWAQHAEITPFSAFGYARPIALQGAQPEFSVSIALPPGGIDHRASFVRLHLEPAPSLSNESSVRVVLNGEPVTVAPIASLRTRPSIDVPIPPLPPGEASLHLSIQPYLSGNQDMCTDIIAGNLLLTLGSESFFHLTPRSPDHSILEFFRPFYDQVTLHVLENMGQAQLETAYGLYSALSARFHDRQTRLLWRSEDGAAQDGGAHVILHSDKGELDIWREGLRLHVRASREAVQALSVQSAMDSAGPQPALLGRGLQVQAIASPQEATPGVRSFRDLGFQRRTSSGIGAQAFRLSFALAQIGGRPRELSAHLKATLTPTGHAGGERVTAQVYFNQTLLETYNLTGKTSLREVVPLPPKLLRRDNQLRVLFVHAPEGGHCERGLSGFTVQMHDESQLTWHGQRGPRNDLDDLPHVFLAPGQVVVDTRQSTAVASAAYLLGVISRLGRQAMMPEVVAAQTVEDWTKLPDNRGQEPARWRLVVSSPGRGDFPAPIRLGEAFELHNPIDQRKLFNGRPAEPIGLLQYFTHQGLPTLWLSWWGSGEAMTLGLTQALADPRTGLGHRLSGNVVTLSGAQELTPAPSTETAHEGKQQRGSGLASDPRVLMWDVGGSGLRVNYPETSRWQTQIRRYRSLLIVLVGLIGAVLAWHLYRRLGRPPATGSAPHQQMDVGKPR